MMLLDTTLGAEGGLTIIEKYGIIGLMFLIIVALCLVIRVLWKDRKTSRDAWVLTLSAKEKQIESKDQEIREMKQDDRSLVKEVTAAIRDGVNVDQQLIKQGDKLLDGIESIKAKIG